MLIPYLGEKSKFKDFIVPNIPTDISTYVEPFGGMFGTYFSLQHNKFNNTKFVYNDINKYNYILFKKLKDIEFFNNASDIEVNYELYKKSLKNINTETDENKIATYWLIILCCSSPYEIGVDSWRNDIKFQKFKYEYLKYYDRILNIDEVENLDYKKIIEKYDSKDTFFYLDPPYLNREDYYIEHNFNEESHYELARVLKSIKGCFLISYFHFDDIKTLYEDCFFQERKTIMGTEILIRNY